MSGTKTAIPIFDRRTGVNAGPDGPRKRFYLLDEFLQAPGINGDLASGTEATRVPTNRQWEVGGTNATSALSQLSAGGGIALTTAGADADQTAIIPHQDTEQSAWAVSTWSTSDKVAFEWMIETGSSVADIEIFCGLAGDATIDATYAAGDNDDELLIYYADGTNSGKWIMHQSVEGTDYTADLGVTVAASTHYIFQLSIDADRKVDVYISDGVSELKHRAQLSTAMNAGDDLVPRIGIEAETGSAKTINVRYAAIGKEYNN